MPAPSDLVHETTASTGTGNLTVASEFGKRTFNTAFGTGGANVFDYFISHRSAAEWERGTGSLSAATTLVRDTVLASSNAGAAVNFSAGTKDVTNDIPAASQIVNPMTTRGDIIYRNATVPARLAIGSAGYVLQSNGTDPGWGSPVRGMPAHGPTGSRYYGNEFQNISSSNNHLFVANTLYTAFFSQAKRQTWTRIGTNVVTAVASTNIRLGIFDCGSDGLPSTLLLDAGAVSSATTGTKEITISQLLEAGFYWLVAVSDGAPTVNGVASHSAVLSTVTGVSALATNDSLISKAFTYGVLSGASPFGTPTYFTSGSSNSPVISLRAV